MTTTTLYDILVSICMQHIRVLLIGVPGCLSLYSNPCTVSNLATSGYQ